MIPGQNYFSPSLVAFAVFVNILIFRRRGQVSYSHGRPLPARYDHGSSDAHVHPR